MHGPQQEAPRFVVKHHHHPGRGQRRHLVLLGKASGKESYGTNSSLPDCG